MKTFSLDGYFKERLYIIYIIIFDNVLAKFTIICAVYPKQNRPVTMSYRMCWIQRTAAMWSHTELHYGELWAAALVESYNVH